MFTAHLTNLTPGVEYGVKVGVGEQMRAYWFRMVNPTEFTFVIGGDIGINPESERMMRVGMRNFDPDLYVVGGDVSYDNGFPE